MELWAPLLIAAFLGPPSSCCKGVFVVKEMMEGWREEMMIYCHFKAEWLHGNLSQVQIRWHEILIGLSGSLVLYENLQFHGEFHSDHDSSDSEDWEVVDPSSDTRMPTTDTSVSVLQQSVEDPDDECYIVFSPGRRHMRAFPLHWKKRHANLSDHLHRIE